MTVKLWHMIPVLAVCSVLGSWLGLKIQHERQRVIRISSDTEDVTTCEFRERLEKYLDVVELRLRTANRDLKPGSIQVEIHQIAREPAPAYQVIYGLDGETRKFTVVEAIDDVDEAAKKAAFDIDRAMLLKFLQMQRSIHNPDSLRACRGFARPDTKKPAQFKAGSVNFKIILANNFPVFLPKLPEGGFPGLQ